MTFYFAWDPDCLESGDPNDVRGTPAGALQEVQLLCSRAGESRTHGITPAWQTVEPARSALVWLSTAAEKLGLAEHVVEGLDWRRLLSDYEVVVLLPPTMERDDTHLSSSIYLAAISMLTGWEMDPTVRPGCPISLTSRLDVRIFA